MARIYSDQESKSSIGSSDHVDAYRELIWQSQDLNKRGNAEAALMTLDQAIQVRPDHPDVYQEMANILRQENRLNEMVQCLIKTIDICPAFREPYHCLALLDFWSSWDLIDPELLELAISTCRKSVKRISADDLSLLMLIYSTIGDLLTAKNNLNDAMVAFQSSTSMALQEKGYGSSPNSNPLKSHQGPDFFIIGGMKCGTSSLRLYLARHPQVVTPVKKEIHFFNTEKYANGIDWYLSYFPKRNAASNFISGEATPCLCYYDIWHKIHNNFPNIQLIVLLRNPVDRTFSHYRHIARGLKKYHSFEQEVEQDILTNRSTFMDAYETICSVQSDCLRESLYTYWLREWLNAFKKENILVLKSEDFYQGTQEIMDKVYDFLELEEYYVPTYTPANQGKYTKMDSSLKDSLREYFRPHNQQLMELLNMDFNWD